MRRLLPLALLIAAILFGAALLRRPKESPVRPTPACSDPSTCGTNVPAPAAPTASPTAPPPDRVATRTVQPSPALAAADGAALRAEADRLIAAGKVEEGIDVFRKAVEAAPTAKNHGDFGGLLYRLTAFDEAALHLRQRPSSSPETPTAGSRSRTSTTERSTPARRGRPKSAPARRSPGSSSDATTRGCGCEKARRHRIIHRLAAAAPWRMR